MSDSGCRTVHAPRALDHVSAVQPSPEIESFADDVRRDLARTPRQLQSKYLYDALGSSLFDAICRLPWYRIMRAERALIDAHASEVLAHVCDLRRVPLDIVELGCGSGEKLLILAEALQSAGGHGRVHLIDISPAALAESERRLGGLRHLSIVGHRDTYEEGLRRVAGERDGGRPMLALLLGSNIGNFDAPAADDFLRAIRRALAPGDALLLGADLIKPEADLLLAYDDPLGVTAAFNRNLLVRVNRELGGRFNLDAFRHVAIWNGAEQRVEMHLESTAPQTASIAAAGISITLARGERIWTESSYKYDAADVLARGVDAGFDLIDQWIDGDARFALTLFAAV